MGYGRGSTAGGDMIFFSALQCPDRLRGPPSLQSNYYQGLSPQKKRPVREADRSPPSSAEVENTGAIPLLPHTSSWSGVSLIKHSGNFITLILTVLKLSNRIAIKVSNTL
jgi:hypothetical protein